MKQPNSYPARRRWLSLRRWFSLAWCGLVAAVIWRIFENWVSEKLEPISRQISTWEPIPIFLGVGLAILAVVWPFGKGRWRGFFGFRHFLAYPPLWVALVVGLLFLEYLGSPNYIQPVVGEMGFLQTIVLIAEIVGGVAFIGFLLLILDNQEDTQDNRSVEEHKSEGFSNFLEWLDTDDEVSNPKDAKYTHNSVALRISDRIVNAVEKAPAVALVGQLGSGKTTIARLVAWHVRSHENISFVRISLWSFETPEAAVRGIIRALLVGIGTHVNILALAGLPDDYVAAIEKAGGKYGPLSRVLQGNSAPDTLLERMSVVVSAIGLRVVLWVEDLERFSRAAYASHEQVELAASERLGSLRALFHLLDRHEWISTVIATTSLETHYDIEKMARFVEPVPSLDPMGVLPDVIRLRTECLDGWPRPVIDPVPADQRDSALPTQEEAESRYLFADDYRNPTLVSSLAILCQTPRVLKAALRLTKDIWKRIPGEIDFDDVLVLSVLRIARPRIFSFIDDHIRYFSSGFHGQLERNGRNPREHPAYQMYMRLLDQEKDPRQQGAIREVVEFLFPAVSNNETGFSAPRRVQGVANEQYWYRYLVVPDIRDAESDQMTLRAILDWRNNSDSDLVDRVVSQDCFLRVEQFVEQFDSNDLCGLLEAVAEAQDRMREPFIHHFTLSAGIASVWRMCGENRPDEALLKDAITRLFERFSKTNLPLVNEIYYLFTSSNDRVRDRLSAENSAELTERFHKGLVKTFSGNGDALIAAAGVGSPYVVYWLSWGLTKIRNKEKAGIPFHDWKEFADALLSGAERNPRRGVPLIIPFVTEGERGFDTPYQSRFDEDAARRLFDFDRLAALLRRGEEWDGLIEEIKIGIAASKQYLENMPRE